MLSRAWQWLVDTVRGPPTAAPAFNDLRPFFAVPPAGHEDTIHQSHICVGNFRTWLAALEPTLPPESRGRVQLVGGGVDDSDRLRVHVTWPDDKTLQPTLSPLAEWGAPGKPQPNAEVVRLVVEKGAMFVLVPLGLRWDPSKAHANMVVVRVEEPDPPDDRSRLAIYLLDPHGSGAAVYGKLYPAVKAYFESVDAPNGYVWWAPEKWWRGEPFLPDVGPQSLENYGEVRVVPNLATRATYGDADANDSKGFCSSWAVVLAHVLIANPTFTTHDALELFMHSLTTVILQPVAERLQARWRPPSGYEERAAVAANARVAVRQYLKFIVAVTQFQTVPEVGDFVAYETERAGDLQLVAHPVRRVERVVGPLVPGQRKGWLICLRGVVEAVPPRGVAGAAAAAPPPRPVRTIVTLVTMMGGRHDGSATVLRESRNITAAWGLYADVDCVRDDKFESLLGTMEAEWGPNDDTITRARKAMARDPPLAAGDLVYCLPSALALCRVPPGGRPRYYAVVVKGADDGGPVVVRRFDAPWPSEMPKPTSPKETVTVTDAAGLTLVRVTGTRDRARAESAFLPVSDDDEDDDDD